MNIEAINNVAAPQGQLSVAADKINTARKRPEPPAPEVPRWDTHTITLSGAEHANPFRDVRLTATFTHASGRELIAEGFHDGETTWRIRFMPTDLGLWTYVTKSNDPRLDGQRGSLQCVPPEAPYLHGPVGARGRHFIHADGTRIFPISARLSCLDATDEAR